MIRIAILICLICTLASAGGSASLPTRSIKLTRYLASGGVERLVVHCPQDDYCEIQRERHGLVVATAGLKPSELDGMLDEFFRQMPASLPTLPGDPVLSWEIRDGKRISQGSVPRFERKVSGKIKAALLGLEASLDSRFYRH